MWPFLYSKQETNILLCVQKKISTHSESHSLERVQSLFKDSPDELSKGHQGLSPFLKAQVLFTVQAYI